MPCPGVTLPRQQLCPVLSWLLAKLLQALSPVCCACRTEHQPQAGGADRQARPPEQAALHRRLLQGHRGPPAQHPLHGGQAEEPEQVQNTKEPGGFPGVQHCRYSTGGWLCFWLSVRGFSSFLLRVQGLTHGSRGFVCGLGVC